jgi:hypothetical protein
MVVRIWHSTIPTSKAEAYRGFLNARAIPDCQAVDGNIGVHILERSEGALAHFMTQGFRKDMDAIRAFAGEDVEAVRYYPEDGDFLLEFEPRIRHSEVVGRSGDPIQDGSGG